MHLQTTRLKVYYSYYLNMRCINEKMQTITVLSKFLTKQLNVNKTYS